MKIEKFAVLYSGEMPEHYQDKWLEIGGILTSLPDCQLPTLLAAFRKAKADGMQALVVVYPHTVPGPALLNLQSGSLLLTLAGSIWHADQMPGIAKTRQRRNGHCMAIGSEWFDLFLADKWIEAAEAWQPQHREKRYFASIVSHTENDVYVGDFREFDASKTKGTLSYEQRSHMGSMFFVHNASEAVLTLLENVQATPGAIIASNPKRLIAKKTAWVKEPDEQRPNLVIIASGNKSLHGSLLKAETGARNWDLMLLNYGSEDFSADADWYCEGPGIKYSYVYAQLRGDDRIKAYDHIMIADDDLLLTRGNISDMFSRAAIIGADLLQPALDKTGYNLWKILVEDGTDQLVRQNFIEIMMPVFSQKFWHQVFDEFELNPCGLGFDLYLWPSLIDPKGKFNGAWVDHTIALRHTRPGGTGDVYKNMGQTGGNHARQMVKRLALDTTKALGPASLRNYQQHERLQKPKISTPITESVTPKKRKKDAETTV